MNIRSLLAGSLATVLSFSTPQFAHAQEPDTGINRSQETSAQARKEVLDRALHVNYDNWQREVVNYDGAAIVLFSSSCPQDDATVAVDRNMDVVYLSLIDKFEEERVNGKPIKFAFYDMCGRSKAEFLGVKEGLQTSIYFKGKLIDTRVGGPTTPDTIPNSVRAESAWVDSNILGRPYVKSGQDMRVVYNGEVSSTLVPYTKQH